MKRHLTLIMILSGALVGTLTGLLLFRADLFRPSQPSPQPSQPVGDLSKASPGAEPPHVRGGGAGAGSAPVTIEEFADFQCPPCGRLYPELKRIEAEFSPRLRLIFRHFPLESHEHAEEAARASEAASAQGRFWEMHDLLFERQREWGAATDVRPLFNGYAQTLGLDVERFKRDMEGQESAARVLSDKQRGLSVQVSGTPTLFLDGREIPADSMSSEGIRDAIKGALSGKGP
jgi:protein-disulfide isomerase